MSSEIASASAALLAVLGLIGIAGWGLRRVQHGVRQGGDGALSARQVLALDPRRRVHLITCGERRVLVLTGGPNDLVLGWLPEDKGTTET